VLLPQPHGFEGQPPTGEETLSSDPSGSEVREHRADLHPHREGGTFGLSGELKQSNHRGASVMDFAKIEPEVVEVLPPLPGELPNAVVPVVFRIVGPLRDGVDDRVLGVERDHAFDSALGKAGERPADRLHVLLRHRLVPQPHGPFPGTSECA
jgi:hypothetical protein